MSSTLIIDGKPIKNCKHFWFVTDINSDTKTTSYRCGKCTSLFIRDDAQLENGVYEVSIVKEKD